MSAKRGEHVSPLRRMFRLAAYVLALASAALLVFVAMERVEINVSPLALTAFNGVPRFLDPNEHLIWADLETTTDGLGFGEYWATLPLAESTGTLELHFPMELELTRVFLLAHERQPFVRLALFAVGQDGKERQLDRWTWTGKGERPVVNAIPYVGAVKTLRLRAFGANRLVLGSIQCFVRAPRWQACVYFASLYGVLPSATAAATILALLGLGAILRPPRDGEDALGLLAQRFALGLLAGFVLATLWCLIPHDWRRFPGRTAAVGAVLSAFAVRGAFVIRRTAAAESLERVVWMRMVWVVLLLLADVAVDTAVFNQNRVRPIDFLFAQQGAQRLAAEQPVPWNLAQRPWLLHVLFAPIDALTGRFSYWAYQGFIAGLNATALVGAALWLRRWKGDGAAAAVGIFALLPLWTAYHFFGQRPFSAGLVLLAAFWWMERRERWWAWGGLALSLAVWAHPSALFILPGAALAWLRDCRAGPGVMNRLRNALIGLVIPVIAYGAWMAFVNKHYPGQRNPILWYPIQLDLDSSEGIDFTSSVWETIQRLPAEHWRRLAVNKFRQLTHYVWSPQWMPEGVGSPRGVCLPNTLTLALTIGLFAPVLFKGKGAFVWIVVAAPLLVHHAYLGHSHAQFHILAPPFFGLPLLACAHWAVSRDRIASWLLAAVFAECFARKAYLVYVTLTTRGSTLDFLAGDRINSIAIAAVPALIFLAGWHWRPKPQTPASPMLESRP
jgi:hypothetical protein